MTKNLIPEIARMLGVELGEEFKIKDYEWTLTITDKGLMAADDSSETGWTPANALFVVLLNGDAEIVKIPWKPKKGDVYFSFALLGDKWVVRPLWCGGFPNEYALLEKGWVYRTCEEAQAALPKVAKELGVEYEL